MAEAAVQAPTTANPPKYFCHKCSVSVDLSPELPVSFVPKGTTVILSAAARM